MRNLQRGSKVTIYRPMTTLKFNGSILSQSSLQIFPQLYGGKWFFVIRGKVAHALHNEHATSPFFHSAISVG
jgi:hypothetical protein